MSTDSELEGLQCAPFHAPMADKLSLVIQALTESKTAWGAMMETVMSQALREGLARIEASPWEVSIVLNKPAPNARMMTVHPWFRGRD